MDYLKLSIRSLCNYVDPGAVTVFFTPPRDRVDVIGLESLGVDVREVPNRSTPFTARNQPQHYGDKTWLCTLDADTVVFLDCDTLVMSDPAPLTDGEFEIAARPDSDPMQQPQWTELFNRFDRSDSYLPWMPNCGLLVFKNGTHRDIGDRWLQYIESDLGYRHDVNHKEQYALALSMGDYDIRQLSMPEHVFCWEYEYALDSIVHHIGSMFAYPDGRPPTTVTEAAQAGMHHLKNRNF